MALPIFLIGTILLGGIILFKSSEILNLWNELKKTNEQRNHEQKIKTRGALGNTYAYIFGEQAYKETFEDKAKPAKIQLGEKKEPQQTTKTTARRRLGGKGSRFGNKMSG